MASQIRAIETRYQGYRFRSRLEARWAVFFSSLGVEWEYEKEGFVIDSIPYLPDFWLPRQRCWVEIKGAAYDRSNPTWYMDTPDDWRLCQGLARMTDFPVFMFFSDLWPLEVFWVGHPEEGDVRVRGSGRAWYPSQKWDDGCCCWGDCPICSSLNIGHHGQHDFCSCRCQPVTVQRHTCQLYNGELRIDEYCAVCGRNLESSTEDRKAGHETWKRKNSPRLLAAYAAARSARFEHRESPR